MANINTHQHHVAAGLPVVLVISPEGMRTIDNISREETHRVFLQVPPPPPPPPMHTHTAYSVSTTAHGESLGAIRHTVCISFGDIISWADCLTT
jgi:hypothetical protein